MSNTKTPIHQWMNDGDRVLIVKCVDADGKGHGGFQWPTSGQVKPLACSMKADCESGGLFGWAWGLNLGGGKKPDYTGRWIVFSAPTSQVVDLGDKIKIAADSPDLVDAIVVYFGSWSGALEFTRAGRLAWINHKVSDSPNSSNGDSSAASSVGYRSAASSVGYSSAASSVGYSSAASSVGDRSAASSVGDRAIAAITGEYSKIEVGPKALGAITSREWYWIVRAGSVVACRWIIDGVYNQRLLVADELGLTDGVIVHVINGVIQK